MQKLLNKIKRNVEFYQGDTNRNLTELIEEYNVLADGNTQYLERLSKILS